MYKRQRKEHDLENDEYYYNKLAHASRYDTADVIYIKRLLQVELEEGLRSKIAGDLFEKVVGKSEDVFSRELYMNADQMKCMLNNGMHIGNHGFDHNWLGSLSEEDQRNEIKQSLSFLEGIGCNLNQWTMCYPYGNYNAATIQLLKDNNCSLGLTTKVNVAALDEADRYELPRLDTNDLPKDGAADKGDWFLKG